MGDIAWIDEVKLKTDGRSFLCSAVSTLTSDLESMTFTSLPILLTTCKHAIPTHFHTDSMAAVTGIETSSTRPKRAGKLAIAFALSVVTSKPAELSVKGMLPRA